MNISTILHYTTEGKERRLAIVDYLETNPDYKIYINRKYWRQIRLDSDLKKLVKKGILKQYRDGLPCSRHSYLVLA